MANERTFDMISLYGNEKQNYNKIIFQTLKKV